MKEDPYSLTRLHDLVEPEAISWWPLAPGWWLLVSLLAVLAGTIVIILLSARRRNAYRRAGLELLGHIETAGPVGDKTDGLLALSRLLKRVALVAYPRKRVASLTGREWLDFLQRTAPTAPFTKAGAGLLAAAGYQLDAATNLPGDDWRELCTAARTWIESHRQEIEAC